MAIGAQAGEGGGEGGRGAVDPPLPQKRTFLGKQMT